MPRKAAKRELIEPHAKDNRCATGQVWEFTESQDEMSKSLSQNRRRSQHGSQKGARRSGGCETSAVYSELSQLKPPKNDQMVR